MNAFLISLFQNPMWYLGAVFALLAAIALTYFLGGFLAGLPNLFRLSANEHHYHYSRKIVTWGTMCLVYLFILWELLRWTVGLFTSAAQPNPWAFIVALLLWLLLLVVPFLIKD